MSVSALVACSHGTADTAGTAAVRRLVADVRGHLDVPVLEAFVDVHGPYVDEVVAAQQGRAVVVPLLLAAGYHVNVDLARAVEPWSGAEVAPALGPDRRLTEVLLDRMLEAGVRPGDVVMLAAAGSSDDAADASVREAAVDLERAWGSPVSVAYGAARAPRLADEVVRLRRFYPGQRVAAVSYLLAAGHFHRRVQQCGADLVTDPLLVQGPEARLADLVVERYLRCLTLASTAVPRPDPACL